MLKSKKMFSGAGYLLLIALAVGFPLMTSNTYYITLFCLAFIYMIAAFGLNFITGMTGQMNLGTAGIFCLGAYTSALLTTRLGISPWLAMLAVIAMGLIIGFGLGYPSLRLKGVYLSLTTIAFGEIVRQLVNNMTNVTGGAQGVRQIPFYNLFGFEINTRVRMYYFLLVGVVLFGFISWRIFIPSGAVCSLPCAITSTLSTPAASAAPASKLSPLRWRLFLAPLPALCMRTTPATSTRPPLC